MRWEDSLYRDDNLRSPPKGLLEYLDRHKDAGTGAIYRRRAAFFISYESWVLIGCVVEAFPDSTLRPAQASSRYYRDGVLFEDWLTANECERFIEEIQKGEWHVQKQRIPRSKPAVWHLERLSAPSQYMTRSGYFVHTSYEERELPVPPGPLVSIQYPYYPNVLVAASDWLPSDFA